VSSLRLDDRRSNGASAATFRNDVPLDLAHYPDANQLAEEGYQRPEDGLPYFTWTDAEGNLRTSYYRRGDMSESESSRSPTPGASVTLTPARELRAPAPPSAEPLPEAFAVLGLDAPSDELEHLADGCCADMAIVEPVDWKTGREFEVRFDGSTTEYDFSDGKSPYRLIRLPSADEYAEMNFRLRSFNRGGVLIPSLIFLDAELNPLRAVQDIAFKYNPETWHRLGFMEATLSANPAEGERWLLIYSREKDQGARSVVVVDGQRGAIRHLTQGFISLQTLKDR